MKLIITLTIAVVLFNTSFAGSGTPSAVIFPKTLTTTLKENKALFEAESAKVCACQILRVVSNNESEKFIAVFAQGTNNGDLTANFASATSVLEKEKKHMKDFFFTKIHYIGNPLKTYDKLYQYNAYSQSVLINIYKALFKSLINFFVQLF